MSPRAARERELHQRRRQERTYARFALGAFWVLYLALYAMGAVIVYPQLFGA